jgi:ketosteroid isomerase-like protein
MFCPRLRLTSARLAVFGFATLLLVVPVAQVFAQRNHQRHDRKRSEREQIVELEQQWQKAALTDDVAAMDRLLSEDYLGITSSGEVLTKVQQLDHMRSHELVISKLQTSELKIKLIGNIAIVTSLARVEGISDGGPLRGAYRYTRVYQRLASGAWKITNFEVTPTTRPHPAEPTQK